MKTDRLTRVNQSIRREIGQILFRVMNERGFDLSAVSVTRVMTSSDLKAARVLISIRDHESERQHMLDLLRKHRGDIQEALGKKLIMKYTPRLSFVLDTSIEEGDRVLAVLSTIEPASPSGAEPAGADDAETDTEAEADETTV